MTSFYMFRLWFKTFFGPEHFEETHHDAHHGHAEHSHGVHESPAIMTLPLAVLALLSIIGGWVGVPAALGGHNEIEHFLEPVFTTGTAEAATTVASHGLELTPRRRLRPRRTRRPRRRLRSSTTRSPAPPRLSPRALRAFTA